jgi:hypothetical protein
MNKISKKSSVFRLDNLHILFWLLKDISWVMEWRFFWVTMIIPALFFARAFNIDLSWIQILNIIFILLITSKGEAAVVGSAFIALAAIMPIFPVARSSFNSWY